jgi:ferritin-like metal-binding protein YciE
METPSDSIMNSTLLEYFTNGLREMYWAETNLVNVLNTMSECASTESLREAFALHVEQTREHARRVEEALAFLGLPTEPMPSLGLQGLFDEGWKVIDESPEGSFKRDVALIIAAQKVEHYEIACYGSLITLAQTLKLNEIAQLFKSTLREEKETDESLSMIAESGLNKEAARETAEA